MYHPVDLSEKPYETGSRIILVLIRKLRQSDQGTCPRSTLNVIRVEMQTYFKMVEKEVKIKSKVKGTTNVRLRRRPEFSETENGQDREKIKKLNLAWGCVCLSKDPEILCFQSSFLS